MYDSTMAGTSSASVYGRASKMSVETGAGKAQKLIPQLPVSRPFQ